MSRRYKTPFLTIVYNNHGWNATKRNVLRLYPEGEANQHDSFWVNFEQPADYAGIAGAAGGAYAHTIHEASQLKEALQMGLKEVQNGRSAVIDVHMKPISTHTY